LRLGSLRLRLRSAQGIGRVAKLPNIRPHGGSISRELLAEIEGLLMYKKAVFLLINNI
jgi:hypothetical protein